MVEVNRSFKSDVEICRFFCCSVGVAPKDLSHSCVVAIGRVYLLDNFKPEYKNIRSTLSIESVDEILPSFASQTRFNSFIPADTCRDNEGGIKSGNKRGKWRRLGRRNEVREKDLIQRQKERKKGGETKRRSRGKERPTTLNYRKDCN